MNKLVTIILLIKLPLKIEETEKHQNDEMAVLESIYASAAAGLMHQRGSGKTDNNLCPLMENEESDG